MGGGGYIGREKKEEEEEEDSEPGQCVLPSQVKTNFYRESAGDSRFLQGLGWVAVHLRKPVPHASR